MTLIAVGDTFSEYGELEARVKEQEDIEFVKYYARHTRTIKSARKKN